MTSKLEHLHLDGESAAEIGEEASLGVRGPGSIQVPCDDCHSNNSSCRQRT